MLTREQIAKVSFGTVTGNSDPTQPSTVILDANPVAAGKHWLILAAWIVGIDIGLLGNVELTKCGFFACPNSQFQNGDIELNSVNKTINFGERVVRFEDTSMIDGFILFSLLAAGLHLFQIGMYTSEPAIIPSGWFFRGMFGQVGGAPGQNAWTMQYMYVEESDC